MVFVKIIKFDFFKGTRTQGKHLETELDPLYICSLLPLFFL